MILAKPFRPLLLLTLLFLAPFNLKAETEDQHIKVALRNIGHQFLLQLNDTTSRILPIEKINGRYLLQFERTFSFQPEELSHICWKVLNEFSLETGYIVEVERCHSQLVVHSFEINSSTADSSIACRGRLLPEDCYNFYFTVIESPNSVTFENAEIGASDISKNSSSKLFYLLLIFPLVAIIILLFKLKNKKQKNENPDLIQIGQFQFDQKRMILHSKSESTELSGKESELLLLLYSNENKTLEREFILNQVWQDTGEYIGRTLDVFISKLRKKLEEDSNLKIINIRGVGYKFVISQG